MKKIVIFGAAGFIGQNVVEKLCKTGYNLVATDIRPINIATPDTVEFISADILDEQHVDGLVKDSDAIIHLATSDLRTSLKNPKRNLKINVQGTINILEAARKYNVKKVIYSSASSIYGVPGLHGSVPAPQ